ncbi:MAG: hypothetical protein O8C67_04310 [Candidatus Methanoperedens sp.]|nr:hypothetical protein [Candidatus Methanoperedens sp.]
MNKQAVIGIVKNIFTYYGYSTSSSDICDLLAEKDSDHLLIKFENNPNFNNIKYFSNIAQSYRGKGMMISESFDEKIRLLALDEGLMLWDRSELESQIGRAVLAGALGYEEKKPSTEKIETAAAQVKEPAKKEYERTIKVMLRSIPINIGKSDALSIAEAKIGTAKSQTLKFIPVWYYNYSFNIQKKYKSKMVDLTGEGAGYIHALTGENFFNKYKDIQDNTFMPTQNYEISQPLVQQKDAATKALNSIIREHTKEVRLNEMIGDTIVFENKIFAPGTDEINFKMDLLHIPVWEIKGKRELIDINAHDGHIMAMRLYHDAEMV